MRVALSLAVSASATAVAGGLFGPPGYLAAIILSLLWMTWRHDTDTGACLPLVILVLIAIGLLGLLLYLLLVIHSR